MALPPQLVELLRQRGLDPFTRHFHFVRRGCEMTMLQHDDSGQVMFTPPPPSSFPRPPRPPRAVPAPCPRMQSSVRFLLAHTHPQGLGAYKKKRYFMVDDQFTTLQWSWHDRLLLDDVAKVDYEPGSLSFTIQYHSQVMSPLLPLLISTHAPS